jgi:hypothetical protein
MVIGEWNWCHGTTGTLQMVYLRGVYVESEKFHFFPEERILSKSFWRAPHEKAKTYPHSYSLAPFTDELDTYFFHYTTGTYRELYPRGGIKISAKLTWGGYNSKIAKRISLHIITTHYTLQQELMPLQPTRLTPNEELGLVNKLSAGHLLNLAPQQ